MTDNDKKAKTGLGLTSDTTKQPNQSETKKVQTQNNDAPAESAPVPEIDQHIRSHLGRKIKASYDDLVRQPVPDKFLHLLEELDRKENEE